jgi:hypothetical protein
VSAVIEHKRFDLNLTEIGTGQGECWYRAQEILPQPQRDSGQGECWYRAQVSVGIEHRGFYLNLRERFRPDMSG